MTKEAKETNKYLAVLSFLLFIASGIWIFYLADTTILQYIIEKWDEWYGVDLFDDTYWRTIPILGLAFFGPAIILFVFAYWLGRRYYLLNFATIHEVNLKELEKAKSALKSSLTSVEIIEREFKGKLESYERLQKSLEELQSVKDLDTKELQKMLNAIASASRYSAWFQRVLGFIIGILSSLIATLLWDRLSLI